MLWKRVTNASGCVVPMCQGRLTMIVSIKKHESRKSRKHTCDALVRLDIRSATRTLVKKVYACTYSTEHWPPR